MVTDSLEIEIQSKADSAVKSLDIFIQRLGLICEGISAIGKSSGLDDFAKQAREAMKGIDGFRDAAKNIQSSIQPQIQKVAKSFDEIAEKYKDLGKGFRFEGSTSAIQKQIDKYSNSLETAKLKKQELEASGNVNGEQYEKAVRDVIEYSNIVESLKNQLKELESVKIESPIRDLGIEEFTERAKTQIQQSLDGLSIENPFSIGDMSYEQFRIFDALKEEAEAARAALSVANEDLQNIGQTASDVSNKMSDAAKAITYNAEAVQMVYGKENAGIQNFQQAIDKFGVKTGGQLGAALSDSFQDTSKQAESLKEKLSRLVVPEIKEDNLKKLESELKKTEEKIDQLRAKLSNELTMGRLTESVDDTKFVKLSEQIALSEKQAEALRQKISEVGTASETADTSGFERQRKSMSSLSTAGKRLISVFSGIRAALSKLGSALSKALSGFGKLAKSILNTDKASKKANSSFGLSLKTVLKYAFGIRSLFVLFNKLRSAIKEGMKNLVQYSAETNASVSMLVSSLATLKNASAAAASPLLNAIAPALNQIIQLFIRATNAVNQFLSALMGRSTWIKAKDQIIDYADSISDASKAVKGALQPFDKLNNLTSQQTESGGVDAGDMFETVPIDDKFKDWADKLKKMWENADFYDLGKLLGEKLKNALDNIPWDKIKETAGKLGKSLASLLNGFIEVEGLGESIGKTLAEALNTGFEFLNNFVHELHWDSLGKFIADALNGLFKNIDWDLIHDTFVTAAGGISEAINNFVDTLDWDAVASAASNIINTIIDSLYILITETDWIAIAEKVGKALSDAFIGIDWAKAGLTVGEAFKAFFGFIATTIENIDWWQIGESVKTFLVNIDWNGVADAFFEAVGAAMGGLAAFLGGLIAEEVVSAGEYFQSKIEEAGGNVVEGILVGICEALVGIGEWIKEHIFKPFLEGFQKAFEIHSPSKVMEGMGSYIVSGLLNGLKEKWSDVVDWITKKIQWVKDKLSGIAGSVKSAFSGGGGIFGGGGQKTSRMSVQNVYSNLSVANFPDIKGYATGVYNVPEDGWFRASKGEYLGHFDDGTSYIANNNQIESGIASGIEQAAYRGMMRALKESGGMGGNSAVNVILEGDAAGVFRLLKEEYNKAANRGGYTTRDLVLS